MTCYTLVFSILGVVVSFPSLMVAAPAAGDIKIWDGQSIEIKQAPHQIAIYRKDRFFCGGSLISKDVVITSASLYYSIIGRTPNITANSNIAIRAGSKYNREGGIFVRVIGGQSYPHENNTVISGIALLKLEKPLAFNENISAIKLAAKDYVVNDGDMMTVTGWGQMRNDSYPEVLQMTELPQYNFDECNKKYGNSLTPYYMCAGYKEGGNNACYGDSGGPLIHKGTLVGVVSGGHAFCAIPKYPAYYSKVSYVREWIDEFMKP